MAHERGFRPGARASQHSLEGLEQLARDLLALAEAGRRTGEWAPLIDALAPRQAEPTLLGPGLPAPLALGPAHRTRVAELQERLERLRTLVQARREELGRSLDASRRERRALCAYAAGEAPQRGLRDLI